MNKEQIKEGIDPALKDEINREGWRGEGEWGEKGGNAAVFVGNKQEIKQAEQRIENEGICADAATYIRLNKKIVVLAEKVHGNIKENKGKGWIGSTGFEFIDSEGNICSVNIDYSKISSIKNSTGYWAENVKQFVNELKEYGFEITPFDDYSYLEMGILALKDNYKAGLERQSKEAKKVAFDF